MKQEDALKLLVEAVSLAQSRGAYSLKEAATIVPAVEAFTVNQNNTMNNENETLNETVVETIPEVVETTEAVEVPAEEVAVEAAPEEAPAEVAETEPSN